MTPLIKEQGIFRFAGVLPFHEVPPLAKRLADDERRPYLSVRVVQFEHQKRTTLPGRKVVKR